MCSKFANPSRFDRQAFLFNYFTFKFFWKVRSTWLTYDLVSVNLIT